MPPKNRRQGSSTHIQPSLNLLSSEQPSDDCAGVTVSVHPVWPDMQLTQGELFFECTLFLYSVLALALQYLNIYKTLWWLPNSFWHYSMKFHLINPYFLSCVGLLLGWRVTKCFWKTITEVVAGLSVNRSQFTQSALTIIEYAVVKTPLMTLIITSFLFSFSRVTHDFSLNSVIIIFCPMFVYVLMFHNELLCRIHRGKTAIVKLWSGEWDLSQVIDRLCEPPLSQLDLDSVLHMCSSNPMQIREEVRLLLLDLRLRLKRSAFAGFSTAFLSIALPCFFVPYKTSLDLPVKVLIDEAWEWELGVVVALTGFSLYVTYLLPLNYLDLLHRSAVHLGMWEPIEGPTVGQTGYANWAPTSWTPAVLYNDGETVQLPDGRCYCAKSAYSIRTVAADPSRPDHSHFFLMCCRPCTLINCMCLFEGALIVVQFWMLVLTTDWQHIVSLVLLMFANYLLLAKLFKDKVILGRLYEPSPEDLALIQQLQADNVANSYQASH